MLIENFRSDSSSRLQPLHKRHFMSDKKVSIGAACVTAVQFELGYGGRYNEELSNEERVVITTGILSSTDHTVFTGTRDELNILLGVIAAYLQVSQSERAKEQAVRLFETLRKDKYNSPHLGLVLHGVPILVGQTVARIAMIGYMAKTRAQVDQLGQVETKSLYSLFEWYLDGASLKEILEIAA